MPLNLTSKSYMPYSVKNYAGANTTDSKGFMVFYMYKLDGYQQIVSYYNPALSLDNAFKFTRNQDCTNNWAGNKFCQLPIGIGEAQALIYDNNNKTWYIAPSMFEKDLGNRATWINVNAYVGKHGKLGSFDEMKLLGTKDKTTKDEKKDEGTSKEQADYETSGKVKPLGKDESGVIDSPLALLIPDFLKINSSWFDGKNPEASKKFNKFLLILLAVGVLAYGRKKRVSRRTARRTTKRVIRRKLPA